MKLLAFLLACLLCLVIFSLLKIHLKFFYKFHHFESKIKADFRILFAHINIEVNIPKEMLSLGFFNMFSNVMDDITKEETTEQCSEESTAAEEGTAAEKSAEESSDEKIDRPRKKSKKFHRYRKFKTFSREVFRHYITSWSKIIWVKRELHKLKRAFFSQINIDSFQASVQIGGRDAAETGLLVGAMWAFFGQITSKLYRMFIVKKNNIRYNVVPRFDDNTFLCKLNCILSFKISHIIFTAYKFLIFILKNRRIRNYG